MYSLTILVLILRIGISISSNPVYKWQTGILPSSGNWLSITYGNGTFLATGASSDIAIYSVDGFNWKKIVLPLSAYWKYSSYGNGKFVLLDNYENEVYSDNLVDWKSGTTASIEYQYCVNYVGSMFISYTSRGGPSLEGAYSIDGISWTKFNMPSEENWCDVAYGNGKFVTTNSGYTAAYSDDGITWTSFFFPSNKAWKNIDFGGGTFVVVSLESDSALYSTDGINWHSTPLPSMGYWYSVKYGGEKFVALDKTNSQAAYSFDGVNWLLGPMPLSLKWELLAYGNGRFVSLVNGNSNAVSVLVDPIPETPAPTTPITSTPITSTSVPPTTLAPVLPTNITPTSPPVPITSMAPLPVPPNDDSHSKLATATRVMIIVACSFFILGFFAYFIQKFLISRCSHREMENDINRAIVYGT